MLYIHSRRIFRVSIRGPILGTGNTTVNNKKNKKTLEMLFSGVPW